MLHFSKHPSRHFCMYTQDVSLLFSIFLTANICQTLTCFVGFVVLGMEARASHMQGKISATEQDPRLIFRHYFNETLVFPWKPGCL